MSKFRPKYNWKDRPVAKVLSNGEFDAFSWLRERHYATWDREKKEWFQRWFPELLNPLSTTEEISGESVGDAL